MQATAALTDQAMNFLELQPVIHSGSPGATLPSALPDEWLNAAIHDLHEYFLKERDVDSEGNNYLTGSMCLLRRLLKDKGIQAPGDVVLDFLEIYMAELEWESMIRLEPSFQDDRATLDNIFEPERGG